MTEFSKEQRYVYEAGKNAIYKMNWKKLAEKYKTLNWVWGNFSGNPRVPTANELEDSAYRSLHVMVSENGFFSSTGGITVAKIPNSSGGFSVYVFVGNYTDQKVEDG